MAFSFNNSFLGGMNASGNKLRDLKRQLNDGILTQEQYNDAASAANAEMSSSIMGGATSLMSGIGSLASGLMSSMKLGDTTKYHNQIAGLSNLGTGQYNSYEQLYQDYDRLGSLTLPTFKEIRGMNDGQKVGSVFSSALTGATTGLTVGGPWGALAGGVVGLGTGLLGVFEGDANARNEQKAIRLDSQYAMETGSRNLSAADERLKQYQFNSGLSRTMERGGKISRHQSLEEFAARALRKPRVRMSEPTARVIREHCKGGTIVRFK